VHVEWQRDRLSSAQVIDQLESIGFDAVPFDPKLLATSDEAHSKMLLRAMAVAGFGAANIMLFSVSVWAGVDMEASTRNLFHWISAIIAVPAVAYAGRPFFRSAVSALKARGLNMDVPISLAVVLATAMSLIETIRGAEHVYFDASVSLLFFLLIGRYLDISMRARACSTAQNLLSLRATAAQVIEPDGTTRMIGVDTLKPGMKVWVAVGANIPVDGMIIEGASDVDASLVTGESLPASVKPGSDVFAGTTNLSSPLTVEVTRADDETLLSEIVRLMEAAEQGRAGYVRLADRIARIYAPAVHILALATFLGWLITGAQLHASLMAAIAVLIITCPCALGLAVPVVQVVASGRLLRGGILVKSADALEKLADIDCVAFDKTGTLTKAKLTLVGAEECDPHSLSIAASLSAASQHPLAVALAGAVPSDGSLKLEGVEEVSGQGLKAVCDGQMVRLGNWAWVGLPEAPAANPAGPELWLRIGDNAAERFQFQDELKSDAADLSHYLARNGLATSLVSGDRKPVVEAVAKELGLTEWHGEQRPGGKIEFLEGLKAQGGTPLMVGDGLNDAPALKAAHVSMSPASAADISQVAADFVFQGDLLAPIAETIDVAKRAHRLILQNFAMAFTYNAIAIPLAIAGLITPLFAAIAMSSSSIIVTLNAMRLTWGQARQLEKT
jgi:Cu2+-exporting ATPase